MQDEYLEFIQEIKNFKDNHVIVKGQERASSKNFSKISQMVQMTLLQAPALQELMQDLEEHEKLETLENFIEVLIFERVGIYLRKTLMGMYIDEEDMFNSKLKEYNIMFNNNLEEFNKLFNSQIKREYVPKKSLRIFKVFFKCQLCYEMYVRRLQ